MMSMENFFNYISKPVSQEDVDVWFRMNNIIPEKLELHYDFIISLFELILDTYLGDEINQDTNVDLSEEDKTKHFRWCWTKTIESFNSENVVVNSEGEHQTYFEALFIEIFYNQPDNQIRKAIHSFFTDLYNLDNEFSRSDLDMITTIYKNLDKNINNTLY